MIGAPFAGKQFLEQREGEIVFGVLGAWGEQVFLELFKFVFHYSARDGMLEVKGGKACGQALEFILAPPPSRVRGRCSPFGEEREKIRNYASRAVFNIRQIVKKLDGGMTWLSRLETRGGGTRRFGPESP